MNNRTGHHEKKRRTQPARARGFSLIELLIVIAVILIIAAIAIPNFIRSKMRADEGAAVANLRDITTAEVAYSTTFQVGFTPTLAALGGTGSTLSKTNAKLIDSVLSSGAKSGYSFSYTVITKDPNGDVVKYAVNADPLVVGETGVVHYYADQTGVIRRNDLAAAGPNDPPIE